MARGGLLAEPEGARHGRRRRHRAAIALALARGELVWP